MTKEARSDAGLFLFGKPLEGVCVYNKKVYYEVAFT